MEALVTMSMATNVTSTTAFALIQSSSLYRFCFIIYNYFSVCASAVIDISVIYIIFRDIRSCMPLGMLHVTCVAYHVTPLYACVTRYTTTCRCWSVSQTQPGLTYLQLQHGVASIIQAPCCGATVCRTHRLDTKCTFRCDGNYV